MIVTFIFTVALWLLDSVSGINSYTVALVPFVIFSLTGVIDRRDLEEINWSVIWMVAGGFALGYALNGSVLAKQAVSSIPFGDFSPLAILVLACLICYALSNFISNSATAILVAPIAWMAAEGLGVSPTPFMMTAAVAASACFATPICTPPNAMVMNAGHYNFMDYVKVGVPLQVIMGIVAILTIPLFFPF